MKKSAFFSYVLLSFFLFVLLNIPIEKQLSLKGALISSIGSSEPCDSSEVSALKAENSRLREDLSLYQIDSFSYHSLRARVVLREPISFGHFLWINRGRKDDPEEKILLKKSPVLSADTLIGIVEEVQQKRSLVRLITDPKLPVSVRAIRGGKEEQWLAAKIGECRRLIQEKGSSFTSKEEWRQCLKSLEELEEQLPQERSFFLAKGLLLGVGDPQWRRRRSTLKGIGFNYDHPDEEGGPWDLRSGTCFAFSLIQAGDLLVTTGLDGVFPKGLPVAVVTQIDTLKEGAYAFSLFARPAIDFFDEIEQVEILPPL